MTPHGIQLLGPHNVGDVTYPPGSSFGPRRMRDYEFVWIIEGDIEYRWGDTVTPASSGALILCRPGETDFFRWDILKPTRHAYFHFDIARHPEDWPPRNLWPLVRQMGSEDITLALFRHILAHAGSCDPGHLHVAASLMVSAFVTGHASAPDPTPSPAPDSVNRALHLMQTRLAEDPSSEITLADLAAAAFVSAEHLCRQFRASTGLSPIRTVRFARLDQAAFMLTRSNSSVKEVAFRCGFATPFHFARVFRSAFGLTPTEMRQAARSGKYNHISLLSRHGAEIRIPGAEHP